MMKNERDPVRRQQLDVRQQALKQTDSTAHGFVTRVVYIRQTCR